MIDTLKSSQLVIFSHSTIFVTFSYRSLAGFLFKLLRSSRRRKPEVALDFCVWPLCALRTFALLFLRILTAHDCARKFTCHAMHERARQVLKWTMIGQMAIAIALLGFNDLGRSVTPNFLFRNRFCLQLSPRHLVQKWTKNQCGKLKNLFFEKPHQLTKFA